MDNHLELNRATWNELATIHPDTEFYDVEAFLAGESTLRDVERRELGEVSGKSFLHLMCHIGLDTLSWAREGADTTGVDFSEESIEVARTVRAEAGLETNFVCCDVYDIPDIIDQQFDIVFASYGVLVWLSDIDAWSEVVAQCLKPGGTFYLVDGHPITHVFDEELLIDESYFRTDPFRADSEGTYADKDADVENTVTYQWFHPLSDIVNSLVSAGLRLEFIHEFPKGHFQQYEPMHEEDGWWFLDIEGELPLLLSLKATKPIEN